VIELIATTRAPSSGRRCAAARSAGEQQRHQLERGPDIDRELQVEPVHPVAVDGAARADAGREHQEVKLAAAFVLCLGERLDVGRPAHVGRHAAHGGTRLRQGCHRLIQALPATGPTRAGPSPRRPSSRRPARPMPRLAPVTMAVLAAFIDASLTRTGQVAAITAATGYRLLADGKEKRPEDVKRPVVCLT